MVTKLCLFLRGEAAAEPLPLLQWIEAAVALDRPRNLEGRGAQQPDILPDPPADRHHDFCREEAVVARLASGRISDAIAEVVAFSDGHPGQPEGRVRELCVHHRQRVGNHRSSADGAQVRALVLDVAAEVRPGLDDLSEVVPDAAQVVHDPRTVADEVAQDLGVGQTHDPPVDPVVEAVQAVDLVGPDEVIEQARDGHHDDEANEQRAEVQHQGHDQGVAEERPAGEGTGPLSHQLVQPRDRGQQQADTADPQRQVHQQQGQQLPEGVADSPKSAAPRRKDREEVVSQGLLPRGSVPVLAVGHGLPGVERGGVAELGPVAHRGVDVDDRRLADHRVLPDADCAHVDEPGVCSIAVDEGVFADDRAVADAEQVGADGHVGGQDHNAAPDLRAQRPQIEVEQRRTGEQHNRVPPHQRLDDPESHVRQAPDADRLGLPATDQDPLRHNRNREQEQKQRTAGNN